MADQLRPRWPKLADLMDSSEHDVPAYMAFPRQHRTHPIERLNKEVKRRTEVVGFGHSFEPMAVMPSLPNKASITRLIGAVLFKQNDEWQTASRYMMVFRGLRGPTGATVPFTLRPDRQRGDRPKFQHKSRLIMTSGHPTNYTTLTDVT